MFPNIDPKKMQAVMRQMGIAQAEIPASRVIIEKSEGGKIIIENPSVSRIKMQGNESFQISGDVSEESGEEDFSENDIKTIIEKTGCSEKAAREALEETGDLAEAILKLSE
ncbi:MAG TPA: nascent polypeptide-associated complex protein [Candidatus Omnitrophota bacterium]|nr:nascent polypeptide-associated complex protein [Candidatus Omnitrophota bacterium]